MNRDALLTPPKTIAVVGLSDKPERPSYQVAMYLQEQGFSIIPVNPMVSSVLGQQSYPSVSAVLAVMHIDIVDIFRKSDEVPAIIQEVIASKHHPVIWMQEGVSNTEAKHLAESHGMTVIMNQCMMKEHRKRNLTAQT